VTSLRVQKHREGEGSQAFMKEPEVFWAGMWRLSPPPKDFENRGYISLEKPRLGLSLVSLCNFWVTLVFWEGDILPPNY